MKGEGHLGGRWGRGGGGGRRGKVGVCVGKRFAAGGFGEFN